MHYGDGWNYFQAYELADGHYVSLGGIEFSFYGLLHRRYILG